MRVSRFKWIPEQRIHRHHTARQDDLAYHRLDLFELMRFGCDCLWCEREPKTVGQDR